MVRMTSSELKHFCFFLRHVCSFERSRAADVMLDTVKFSAAILRLGSN